MKKRYITTLALTLLLSACTVKFTNVTLNQEGEGSKSIDLKGLSVTTETDQKADGKLNSAVDNTPFQ